MSAEAENIRVAVRCRPMSEKEIREQAQSCFVCKNGNAVLTNPENKDEVHEFGFDFVYGSDTEQRLVYEDFGRPVLERAFGGYNGTIFAYGQTGSGKTFSMTGIHGNESLQGLIPRMNNALFEKIQAEKTNDPNKLFLVECSFFEIYNEIIYDLLDTSPSKDKKNKGLEIKEHSVLGIYVKDLQERVVESREEVVELMALGASNRTVGYTNMNSESSRSHSIFVMKIHQKDSSDETKNVFAKVNLVDLAGSERAAGTGAVGTRLKEGANINKSLSALGNVINALVEDARTGKKSFIPYRNSKLTRVLQESLGGNSLCSMLATLSPANINFIETLGTLKYASRAKSIKVNAKKNEEASQISQLNEEIATLKKKLLDQTDSGLDPREKNEIVAKYEKQIQEMDAVRMQTWEDKAKLSKQHELERKKLAKEKARADQKTQEEKVKKWKLLESKGDIELAIRATRELEVGDDTWITSTTRAKSLEQDVKDARTLICVFKDSLDKDVASWKAMQSDDAEDAAGFHTTASQLCTKIKNIQEESTKMMALESELLRQTSVLIDALCEEHEKLTSSPPSTTKELKQLFDDREKALTITRTMIHTYRANLVVTLKAERKRILNFTDASDLMLIEMENQTKSSNMDEERKKTRILATKSLNGALDVWKNLPTSKPSDEKVWIPKGEVHSLGIETKTISDDKITVSSGEPKNIRLNGQTCWVANAEDAMPWIKVDFGTNRFIDSIHIQGGVIGGPSVLNESPLILTKQRMSDASAKYDPSSVTGDHQQTYDIAQYIMSWTALLKTTQIPTKLFSRPPVRFLHDVITTVVKNTGYGQGIFNEKEKDYSQLSEKKEKSDFLLKVLQLVQTSYEGIVEIKATESNILAGKEPEQTMQWFGLFCLGAIRHLASTLPETTEQVNTTPPNDMQQAWVTEINIETSLDNETWTSPLNVSVQGCSDAFTVVSSKVPAPILARYVKLLPTKWSHSAALRCDLTGFNVIEKDNTLNEVQDEVLQYLGLLTTLFTAGELILDEAKVKWRNAKESQREKQAELKNLAIEMDTWKAQVKTLKSELEQSNSSLDILKAEKKEVEKQLSVATIKAEAINQTNEQLGEQIKKTKGLNENLTQQLNDVKKDVATTKQQHSQATDELKSMSQSKVELEKLIENLRNQLTSKSATDGATDSKLAALSADLQSMTIQLDESKRALQRSELSITESNAEKDSLQNQINKTREELSMKEGIIESNETKFKLSLSETQSKINEMEDLLRDANAKFIDVDGKLQKALAVSTALQSELDMSKKRGSESNLLEIKRLQDEATESEQRMFLMQTNQIRLEADNERLEAKYTSVDEKVKTLEIKLNELNQCMELLQKEKKQLIEQEEELQLQLQVVTDERDSARQKEEQLFIENAEKEQEIERIRDGYVWVTDRMNNKEDELAELQEQLEKYQSLLKLAGDNTQLRPITMSPSHGSNEIVSNLFKVVFDKDLIGEINDGLIQLTKWIEIQKNHKIQEKNESIGPQLSNELLSQTNLKLEKNKSNKKELKETEMDENNNKNSKEKLIILNNKKEIDEKNNNPTIKTNINHNNEIKNDLIQPKTFIPTRPPLNQSNSRRESIEDLAPTESVDEGSNMKMETPAEIVDEQDNEYDDDFDAYEDDTDGTKRRKSKRKIIEKKNN